MVIQHFIHISSTLISIHGTHSFEGTDKEPLQSDVVDINRPQMGPNRVVFQVAAVRQLSLSLIIVVRISIRCSFKATAYSGQRPANWLHLPNTL